MNYELVFEIVLTFESVDEILLCDHSNETSSTVLSRDTIILSLWMESHCVIIQMKPLQQYFHMVLFI